MEPFHQLLTIEQNSNDAINSKNMANETPKFDFTENEATNLQLLRTIISISSGKTQECVKREGKSWQPVLMKLLHVLCSNREIGNQTILLTSHAFLSLQRILNSLSEFEKVLLIYFGMQVNQMEQFGEIHEIWDRDTFKLVICHGVLQLNQEMSFSIEIYENIFEIVYPHCMRYTQHSYFSFKILQIWSQKSLRTSFWDGNTRKLEGKLEAVLFSNWDNAICKSNVVAVFSVYLKIMKEKYEGFLPYLFHSCIEKISWCHTTKYTILAEICHLLDSNELMKEQRFVSNLFSSLTIPHLCNSSTKLFLCICNKLSQDEWKAAFGENLREHVTSWESKKEYCALQVLCRYWIEPLVKIHRDILLFLSTCCDEKSILYLSHLLRISRKHGETPSFLDLGSFELLNHEEEFIRLNLFAAHCYGQDNLGIDYHTRSMEAVKNFLFFNATTNSTYLREGIFNYFKIYLSGMLKRASVLDEPTEALALFDWLYEFEMDCFEVASCYQRKIFGLILYKLCLQFLFGNQCTDCILSKDPIFKVALKYGSSLREQMKKMGKWRFIGKQSLVHLLKLVLDSAADIRENSTLIITEFFNSDSLSNSEKSFLFATALHKCNSYKFSETESGACLFKILSKWVPLHNFDGTTMSLENISKRLSLNEQFANYTRFLLEEMKKQLNFVKQDVLKAATQNSPYYGVVTALLFTTFKNGPECDLLSELLLDEILTVVEDAVQDFLNLFSFKSANLDYSSSFEEMGLAVDEAIKRSEMTYELDELILSPVQQLIVTITWRSLKVLCELAVEIVKSKHVTNSMIHRASEVIATVSLKCRHKGVIESAGYAMGDLSRYLCRNQKSMEVLENYVEKLLHNEFAANINLTRRGAGLTILFHRIITNDIRTDRPLFHYAMNSLIQSLELRVPMQLEQRDSSNYDDPRAMSLHFLTTLVADKQLQAQLNPYLDHVCLICLEYMTSPVFAIRNASSQLYGAIITRLVGQNSGSKNLDFGYGHSVNYFVTHFPQLAAHVLKRLQTCCGSLNRHSSWQESANVVPILPLLSKMFFSGCELIDGATGVYVDETKNCLYSLLSSPVAHIRSLAAKCLVAFTGTSPSDLAREEHQLKCRLDSSNNLNHWNGYLQALEFLIEKNNGEKLNSDDDLEKIGSFRDAQKSKVPADMEYLWTFWNRRLSLNNHQHLNFAIEAQLLRLSLQSKLTIPDDQKLESVGGSFSDFPIYMRKPGFFEFVDELMKFFVYHLYFNDSYAIMKYVLKPECLHLVPSFLKIAPRNDRNLLLSSIDFGINNFEIIDRFTLQNIIVYMNESIRGLLFDKIIGLDDIDLAMKIENFVVQISKDTSSQTQQLSELLTYIHLFSHQRSKTFEFPKSIIFRYQNYEIPLSDYFTYPETIRELIARGFEILLLDFNNSNDESKRMCLLLSLTLLKDEVASIRETIRNSVLNNIILPYNLSETRVSFEIVYTILLLNLIREETVVGDLDRNQFTEFFEQYFSTITRASPTSALENPFDDDDITCFKEESKLMNIIVYCFEKRLSQNAQSHDTGGADCISEFVFVERQHLLERMNLDPNDLENFLNIKPDQHQIRKVDTVIEVYFKDFGK